MTSATHLVQTAKERCRVCYTCVRECPAKAIRIGKGQAEVLAERCIGCGNCVRVCSQKAKVVLDSTVHVRTLLAGGEPVVAVLAPSFPAEFTECSWRQLVGMIRELGFAAVHEVGFGADLVADRYRKLLEASAGRRYIATSCPAVVAFVEKYHPDLVDALAPIVSPMVAIARALRRGRHDKLRVVFIGPCVAKKGEVDNPHLTGEVDAALTFPELRAMFQQTGIVPKPAAQDDFDAPHAGLGALFSISRGLLQAADIHEDLLEGHVVAADGRTDFVDAIKEFETGDLDARLLELLACKGCITGPGISPETPVFFRRARVAEYVRQRLRHFDQARWQRDMESLADLDLSRTYTAQDQHISVPFEEEVRQILARIGKQTAADELNCGACGYDTCREHAVAIFKGLAETEMCLPYTIDQLHTTVTQLAESHKELASAQEALMQSEKLASMGQLAAGIAHEVNNPLGIVLMYAHLLLEEHAGNEQLRQDMSVITEQADRCKRIVSGLLHFARQNKVLLQPVSLRQLIQRALRSVNIPDSIRLETHVDLSEDDDEADLDADQMIQVLTNLLTNAVAAMEAGGTLTLRAGGDEDKVTLAVSDTGVGIPKENLTKIFEPFFTTKQIGVGTGLGLAVAYGVVKMHRGDIQVTSNADKAAGPTGTTFAITLPRREGKE